MFRTSEPHYLRNNQHTGALPHSPGKCDWSGLQWTWPCRRCHPSTAAGPALPPEGAPAGCSLCSGDTGKEVRPQPSNHCSSCYITLSLSIRKFLHLWLIAVISNETITKWESRNNRDLQLLLGTELSSGKFLLINPQTSDLLHRHNQAEWPALCHTANRRHDEERNARVSLF